MRTGSVMKMECSYCSMNTGLEGRTFSSFHDDYHMPLGGTFLFSQVLF